MFERKKFKAAALEQLKGRWKIPVVATILMFALVSIFNVAAVTAIVISYNNLTEMTFVPTFYMLRMYLLYVFLFVVEIIFFIASLSVHNTMLKESRKICFSDFTNGLNQWWQATRGGLWFCLWVYLWSLLFFIPGIVKSYAYSMMFFVMAENPKISVRKAMQISKELTRGYKGELFVLHLSFIGWMILSSITCGIGFLWLVPYMSQTHTNVYQYLKRTAIESNRIAISDFE